MVIMKSKVERQKFREYRHSLEHRSNHYQHRFVLRIFREKIILCLLNQRNIISPVIVLPSDPIIFSCCPIQSLNFNLKYSSIKISVKIIQVELLSFQYNLCTIIAIWHEKISQIAQMGYN